VAVPQTGIFALGTASHAYLELTLRSGRAGAELVGAVASMREPRTTMGGVNLVAGFRPSLWHSVVPDAAPAVLHDFATPVAGPDGFTMPATQRDCVLWLSGGSYDVIFDASRAALGYLGEVAVLADETTSWPYRHDLDLTGFVDGTENPTLIEAAELALVPDGRPGEGGSFLLLQKWLHDADAWEGLPVSGQEQVIGRTKATSDELDPKAPDSHVAKTDQEQFGKILRRNMPFGTVSQHGTMFVGFSSDQRPLDAMLESMAGVRDGVRDALTRFTTPITGAYYFVPSGSALARKGSVATPMPH
jgi:putative iron-dependent peroxidase